MKNDYKIPLVGVLCLTFSVFVLLLMGLNANTLPDYSYHLHEIWAISEGNFLSSPFVQGFQFFHYGLPFSLAGALIFPLFGELTLVVLSGVAFILLFFASRKVYRHFVSERVANICAFFSVMNPGTYAFVLGGTIPFLWGIVFGMFSLGFFLDGEKWKSSFSGILTVVTHPLAVLIFPCLFFVEDIRKRFLEWVKVYSPTILLSFGMLAIFFGLLSGMYAGGGPNPHFVYRLPFLLGVLVLSFGLMKKTRWLSGLTLGGVMVWFSLSFVGVWFPMNYFGRPAFALGLLLIPFVVQKWTTIPVKRRKKLYLGFYCSLIFISTLLPLSAPGVQSEMTNENEIAENVSKIVGSEPVYLASRGEEFYQLPRENVRFVNKGVIRWSSSENLERFLKTIENENVSYVVYNGSFPYHDVENIFTEVYQKDNFYVLKFVGENNYSLETIPENKYLTDAKREENIWAVTKLQEEFSGILEENWLNALETRIEFENL